MTDDDVSQTERDVTDQPDGHIGHHAGNSPDGPPSGRDAACRHLRLATRCLLLVRHGLLLSQVTGCEPESEPGCASSHSPAYSQYEALSSMRRCPVAAGRRAHPLRERCAPMSQPRSASIEGSVYLDSEPGPAAEPDSASDSPLPAISTRCTGRASGWVRCSQVAMPSRILQVSTQSSSVLRVLTWARTASRSS